MAVSPGSDPIASDPISVVGKVDRILSAFDDRHTEIGLSELARRTSLAKPTVYRLATELVQVGLLDRTGEVFSLGARLFELGLQVPRYRAITQTAIPFVEDLYVATGATVYLGVRESNQVLYVIKVRGHGGENRVSHLAGRMPVHCTATGRAILAAEPEEVLEECLAARLPRLTPHTVVTPNVIRQIVDRARAEGMGVEREEVRLGYGAAASAVLGPSGPVGAISIAAPIHRRHPAAYKNLLRDSATALSHALNARHPPEEADPVSGP
jgi:DNA-binding IclR family transcriptional regulator